MLDMIFNAVELSKNGEGFSLHGLMDAEKKFELIADVVLQEDTQTVIIDSTSSGESLELFDAFYIIGETNISTNIGTYDLYLNDADGNYLAAVMLNSLVTATNRGVFKEIFKYMNGAWVTLESCVANGSTWYASGYVQTTMRQCEIYPSFKKCKQIKLSARNVPKLTVGTKIKVYGVRA